MGESRTPKIPPMAAPALCFLLRVQPRTLPGSLPGLGSRRLLVSAHAALFPDGGTAAPEERGAIWAAASHLLPHPFVFPGPRSRAG